MNLTRLGVLIVSGTIAVGAQADDLTVNVADRGDTDLIIAVTGGTWLHSLEQSDLLADDWRVVQAITTRTNIAVAQSGPQGFFRAQAAPANDISIFTNATTLLDEGREAFRHNTFGSESFWGGALKLHQPIAGTN